MMKSFVALFLVFSGAIAGAQELSTIRENNTGVEELSKEKGFQAEKTFLNALGEDPFNKVLHYNLGTAYLLEKKYEAAIKEYDSLIRRPDLPKELGFAVHFNAAVAAAENKNVDLALKYYQGALNIKPDSKEVKTNIELLTNGEGGGGGGGQGQNKNDKPQDGKDPGQNPQNGDPKTEKRDKPIGEKDMENILEELGRQEQRIRALEYGTKKGAEKGPAKDW